MVNNNIENKLFNPQFPDLLITGELYGKYKNEDWYHEIHSYIQNKYVHLEKRLLNSFNYVQLDKDNGTTFSNEFSSILRDSGSVFSSLIDKIYRKVNPNIKKKLFFKDYRKFILNECPNFPFRTISIRMLFPFKLKPYEAFKDLNGIPKWWDSYNKIKHLDIEKRKEGNLKNTINAVGALAILLGELTRIKDTALFSNIGMIFRPDKRDIQPDRILFQDP